MNSVEWAIFPNPTSSALNIKTNATGSYKLEVSDMTGKNILNQAIANAIEMVDVSYWNAGTYLVTITDNSTGKKSVNRCVKL